MAVFLSAGHSLTDPGAVANGRSCLSYERLRAVLDYAPSTGEFRWRERMSSRALAGSVAGTRRRNEYTLIRIDGVLHAAHRLAWFYVNGYFPSCGIDHRNGDKSDNRMANLREANHTENAQNQALRRDSRSGIVGVQLNRGKWRARIRHNGITYQLGGYDEPESAAFAYSEAKAALHKFQPTVRQS